MATCQECGCEVEDSAKFCRNCGSKIVVEKESVDETGSKFCGNCGFEMPKATKFCPECGHPTDAAPRDAARAAANSVAVSDKSPGLAAILSFFIIGLGQIYLGLNKKGIILFLAAIISGCLMIILIGFILWFLIWAYAVYDAYNSAEKMQNGIAVEDSIDIHNLF